MSLQFTTMHGGPLAGRESNIHCLADQLPETLTATLPGPKPRVSITYRLTGRRDERGHWIYEHEEPTT